MKNNYLKLKDDCYISKNESSNITAFLKYRKGNKDKYYAEILIFDDMEFRFTLEYVIEKVPFDIEAYTTFMLKTNILNNTITFDSIAMPYWKDRLNNIEELMMYIFNKEYIGDEEKCM